MFICSPLRVTAMTRNADGEQWGRLLEFEDPDHRPHHWACPMELLASDGVEFRRVLASMGLIMAGGARARQHLMLYLQSAHVDTRAVCTDRTGWHGGVYVLPDDTLGASDERVLLQTLGEPPRMRQAGTAEAWRDQVGRLCAGNSRLIMAVCASFAAPLLALTGDESGGVHLVGASSTGKTTALRVAASVWGGNQYLKRWRATANGLEAIAQGHNDALLVLDELAQVSPHEAGEIAYMLANGSGKQRARRDGLARPASVWRVLFLSAGEVGLADHMAAVGKRAKAGQEVRLADVPVEGESGQGLFQELHGHPSGAALADALTEAVRAEHGTAAREYLRVLVENPHRELRQSIEAARAEFLASVLTDERGRASTPGLQSVRVDRRRRRARHGAGAHRVGTRRSHGRHRRMLQSLD